ncbi:MAG: CopG family transcriptional regulator [Halanaeroarchaeum sp.]
MTEVEVTLPDDVNAELDRLVEQGEFISRDQAAEELLSMGISAYDSMEPDDEPRVEETVEQTFEDQQDPAAQSEDDDRRTF